MIKLLGLGVAAAAEFFNCKQEVLKFKDDYTALETIM